MARPSRSRIIPAQHHRQRKVEKWQFPDLLSTEDNSAGIEKGLPAGVSEQPCEPVASIDQADNDNGQIAPLELHEAGYDAGYQEGLQAAEKEFAEQQQQLTDLLRLLENPVRALGSSVTQELMQLSVDIARGILQKELEADQSLLAEFVTSAVSQLPESTEPVSISAHPAELERIKKYAAPAFSGLTIQWRDDTSLDMGCFKVNRANSLIDGGIEAMLKSVLGETELVV